MRIRSPEHPRGDRVPRVSRLCVYGVTEAEGFEAPFELVRVTTTPVTGLVVPLVVVEENVNGMVSTNVLPNGFERGSLYQVVNGVVSGTVTLGAASVVPAAAVKSNCPLVMSRVVE